MKVFILTDLEGPAGVNGRPDAGVGNSIINRSTAAQALANEINACCEGLLAAGATDIVVLDGHGGSNSLDIFQIHRKACLFQAGALSPVPYLDGSYDAVIQLGAHAMQQSNGFLCHTFNSHGIAGMTFNGQTIGEIGMASMLAAYFHVPTIMVSGDEAACSEARDFLGEQIETVSTKCGFNRYSAVNYPLDEVYEQLRQKSSEALRKAKDIPCIELPEHCELVMRMMCPNQADAAEKLGIERLDEVTLRFVSDDFVEIMAQFMGWAPGVHKQKYNVTPQWLHPYSCKRK